MRDAFCRVSQRRAPRPTRSPGMPNDSRSGHFDDPLFIGVRRIIRSPVLIVRNVCAPVPRVIELSPWLADGVGDDPFRRYFDRGLDLVSREDQPKRIVQPRRSVRLIGARADVRVRGV
jgi:hypothetical protein